MISRLFLTFLLLGVAAAALETQENPRDFTGYPSSPVPYDSYDSGTSFSADKWAIQPSFLMPNMGCGPGGLLKPLLAGLIGAILLKIPLFLAGKLLLLKLAVPVALLTAAAPLAVPLYMMFFNKNKDSMPSSTPSSAEQRSARAINEFFDSSCLERIACTLGHTQGRSESAKTFTWMLKSMESVLGKQSQARAKVSSYRSAYLTGASEGTSCAMYNCTFPELIVRQGESTYKIF